MERLINDMKAQAHKFELREHGYRLAGRNDLARRASRSAQKLLDTAREIEEFNTTELAARQMPEEIEA